MVKPSKRKERGKLGGAEERREAGAVEFVDLSRVYDADLRRVLEGAGKRAGLRIGHGVYVGVSGPSYETPAEIRAFRRLGGDAVGMSTIPEAVMGAVLGLRVAGVSCITNLASGLGEGIVSHEEVLLAGEAAAKQFVKLIEEAADKLG